MKRLAAVILAIACLTAAVRGYAHGGGDVEVAVVSGGGEIFRLIPQTSYEAGRTQTAKKYIEAARGQTYSVVVRNNTPERVGVVVAVDGRNIIDGSMSSLKNTEAMYIVDPYRSEKLDGWRTDRNTTHQFYFTDEKDSYSVRTFGDTSAMGVIAVAAFREKVRHSRLHEQSREKAPAPAAGAASRSEGKESRKDAAGTGFGEERYSPTVAVAFEPEGIPFTKTLIKYEWRETLCRKGILTCRDREQNRLWDDRRYAPFPPPYAD